MFTVEQFGTIVLPTIFIGSLILGPVTLIVLFALLFTNYYYISLAYGLYLLIDWKSPNQGGWRWRPLTHASIFTVLAPLWFPAEIIPTTSADAFDATSRNYLLGVHPHGILPISSIIGFRKADNFMYRCGLRVTGTSVAPIFLTPILREFFLSHGCCVASSESLDHLLGGSDGKGNAVCVIVGGAREAILSEPRTCRLVLKNRFGFVRKALKHGAHLVPCVSFGDNEIFVRVKFKDGSWLQRLQAFLVQIGISLLSFRGQGFFKVLPKRIPLRVYIGAPMHVEKCPQPTDEQVKALHKQYCDNLFKLYEDHKNECGYEGVPMEIM